jgi:hypothetical protein
MTYSQRLISRISKLPRNPYVFPIGTTITSICLMRINSPILLDIFWFLFISGCYIPIFITVSLSLSSSTYETYLTPLLL